MSKSALYALSVAVATSAVKAEPFENTYSSYSQRDHRLDYPLALMEMALQKADAVPKEFKIKKELDQAQA